MKRLLYSLKRERNGERSERVKAGEAERPLEKRKKKKKIKQYCISVGVKETQRSVTAKTQPKTFSSVHWHKDIRQSQKSLLHH